MHKLIPIILLTTCWACSPKVSLKPEKTYPKVPPYEGFALFELSDAFDESEGEYLGMVSIKDAGLTIGCDYKTVLRLAERQAREIGGNALKITKHKPPRPGFSTCHRIDAKVYRLADVSKYEKTIVWDTRRRLRKIDFKGSTENRPFAAATYSGISWEYSGSNWQGSTKLTVSTIFDCRSSYFKDLPDEQAILEHEQGHFDLSEAYARKFVKEVSENVKNVQELQDKINRIYDENMRLLQLEQDRYDSDVYADRSKQPGWLVKIQEELAKYEAFAKKELIY